MEETDQKLEFQLDYVVSSAEDMSIDELEDKVAKVSEILIELCELAGLRLGGGFSLIQDREFTSYN